MSCSWFGPYLNIFSRNCRWVHTTNQGTSDEDGVNLNLVLLCFVIPYNFFSILGIKINIFTVFKKNLKILESAICWPSTVFGLLDRVRSVDCMPYFYWLLKIAAGVCHVISCRLRNDYWKKWRWCILKMKQTENFIFLMVNIRVM